MQPRFETLTHALEQAAQHASATTGYTFLNRGAAVAMPYRELWRMARQMAATLQAQGIGKGDRVVITLPTSPEFAQLYWGLQLCGAVPCVLPAPSAGREQSQSVQRIVAVARQIAASAIIGAADDLAALAGQDPGCPLWDMAQWTFAEADTWQPVAQSATDLAVIQATSGSTSSPKCVAVSQFSMAANLEQIGQRLRIDETDVKVGWLPLYHDMGLVGCFFLALYWSIPGIFLTPFQFLRDPRSWLQAISTYKGTLSPAPNFAYALTYKRVSDDNLVGLNLASWKAAICGGEQINTPDMKGFIQRFQAVGFSPNALVPAYGMAEAALCITMYSPGEPLHYETVDQRALAERAHAIPVNDDGTQPVTTLCDCGAPVAGTHLCIRNDAGAALADGQVGRIWVAGPSLLREYFNQPAETAALLRDGWLDTGDLGYLRHGRLFVVGRAKEVIIIRGHNYSPIDFERAAEEVAGVAAGRVVAVGIPTPAEGTEQLVLICEQPREIATADKLAAWQRTIQSHVGKRTGLFPAQVVAVPRNSIPRTTSGKLQRGLARKLVMEGLGA